MKKRIFAFLFGFILLFCTFSTSKVYAQVNTVYLGGFPAGFSIETRGAYVIGLTDVLCDDGVKSPAKDVNIEVGDVILSIDNKEVNNAEDIAKVLTNCNEKVLNVKKNNQIEQIKIKPVKDTSGYIKLGLFIRDNVNGIGTITFIKGDRFASLGHPVLDDNGKILEINSGSLFNCNITGCVKGERGKPGELRGVFLKKTCMASIDKNINEGVYGNIKNSDFLDGLTKIELGKAQMGDAEVYTTICGEKPKKYSISIIKSENGLRDTKNFVIKINDKDLLETTGGIVQGMSGSPIIQNNKLVGAITHVFVNDPTRGFGISIYNMLNN